MHQEGVSAGLLRPQPQMGDHASWKWSFPLHSSFVHHLWALVLGVPGEESLGMDLWDGAGKEQTEVEPTLCLINSYPHFKEGETEAWDKRLVHGHSVCSRSRIII